MAKIAGLTSADLRILANMNVTRGVLAINAASAATVKTTNAIVYLVDGIFYNKAALSAQALSALAASDLPASLSNWLQPSGLNGAFYVQPTGKTVYYVLAMNAAGTVKVVQGTYDGQELLPGVNSAVGKSIVPDVPAPFVPFGLIKVVTGSATFTPATTALDASNITFTFYDVGMLGVTDNP